MTPVAVEVNCDRHPWKKEAEFSFPLDIPMRVNLA